MNMDDIWEKAKLLLRERLTVLSYKTWIAPLVLQSIDDNAECIYLLWPNQPKLIAHINEHYLSYIKTAIAECNNKKYRVEIKPKSQLDVLQFINSRAISDHLKNIKYEFNSLETAWLIYQCRRISIEEKHKAWREVIETMPDCRIERRCNTVSQDSLHNFLKEYMRLEDKYISEFCSDENDGQFVYKFEYIYGINDYEDTGTVFSSFDAIYSTQLEPDEEVIGIKVTKMKVDQIISRDQIAYLDPHFRFMKIEPGVISDDHDGDLFYVVFDGLWFDFPTPFTKGDILWNPQYPDSDNLCGGPFVLRYINLEGLDDKRVDRNVRSNGDSTDMTYQGFFACADKGTYEECHSNYMDLEYYTDRLEGGEKILKPISEFMKGEIDVILCCQAYYKIMTEIHGWVAPYFDSSYVESLL